MTLIDLLDERAASLAGGLRTFRAVRSAVAEPTPAEINQWQGMGLVRDRAVEHENAPHQVLVPGPRFAAYTGTRTTAPVGAHALRCALLGELLAARLSGKVTLATLAAAARSPVVKVSAARHVARLDLEDGPELHALWLHCPTPATVTTLLDDTRGIPLTLYVPDRAPGRRALDAHPRRDEFTLTPFSVYAWPPP